jgi:hypothetical protein
VSDCHHSPEYLSVVPRWVISVIRAFRAFSDISDISAFRALRVIRAFRLLGLLGLFGLSLAIRNIIIPRNFNTSFCIVLVIPYCEGTVASLVEPRCIAWLVEPRCIAWLVEPRCIACRARLAIILHV